MLPAEILFVPVGGGVRVAVTDAGPPQGLPLVLLGPEPFGVSAWGPVVDDLRRHARTLSVDVRARGHSPPTLVGHGIAQYADDLRTVLASQDVTDFVGVGWSLGVSVLWEYHHRDHGGLQGIVAVDQPAVRAMASGELEARLARIRHDRRAHHEAVVAGYVGPDDEVPPALRDELVAAALRVPTEAHARIVEESYQADYRPVVERLGVPMLVCWGDFGTLGKEEARRLAGATPGGAAVHVPGTGHLLPRQRPSAVAEVIVSFWNEMNGRASAESNGA